MEGAVHDESLTCAEIAKRYAIISSRDFNIPTKEAMEGFPRAMVAGFWRGQLQLWNPYTTSLGVACGNDVPIDPRDVIYLLRCSSGYLPDLNELRDDTAIVSPIEADWKARDQPEQMAALKPDASFVLAAIHSSDPWESSRRTETLDYMMAVFASWPPFTENLWRILGQFKTTRTAFDEFYRRSAVWPNPCLETWWPAASLDLPQAGESRLSHSSQVSHPHAKRNTGPKKGSGQHVVADRELYPSIAMAVQQGKTPTQAIGELVDVGRVAGAGVRESKIKRVRDRYLKDNDGCQMPRKN